MLYIVRGLPGSGKSTFARKQFPGLFHVENDMYWMNSTCKYVFNGQLRDRCLDFAHSAIRLAMLHGMSAVVSNVFVSVDSINSFRKIATTYGQLSVVIRLTSQFNNIHNVPKDVFESMKANFQNYDGEYIVSDPSKAFIL